MNLHLVLSDLISWQYLLLIMLGFLFFLWLIWGGRDDLEYVGLKPLFNQSSEEEDEENRENEENKDDQNIDDQNIDDQNIDKGNIDDQNVKERNIKENDDPKGKEEKRFNFTPKIPAMLSEEFSMGFSDEIEMDKPNIPATLIDLESYDSFSDIIKPSDIKTPNTLALGEHKAYNSGKISKGEALCKKAIEDIYQKPFYCVRPDFLKNPETGRNLELDMYNDSLKIAVEYNHVQHYIYPNSFHKTHEEFMNQIRRDKFKVEACDQNGVYLITVPYNVPLNYQDIRKYIEYYLPENVAKRSGIDLNF